MLKFIKENWLIAVISGVSGSVITLFFKFTPSIKTWDSNAWSAFFNFFAAAGTIGAVCTTLYLTKKSSGDAKVRELKSNVNSMIKQLETFFIRLVELEQYYSLLTKNLMFSLRITKTSDRDIDAKNKVKEEFSTTVNNCKYWLSIQKTNNSAIDNIIRELEKSLNADIIDKKASVMTIQHFTKEVRKILANLS